MTVYSITTLVVGFVDSDLDPTVHTGTGINQAQWLSALIGVVLPILVGLVTKYSDSPRLKSLLLLALSAVSGFLTEALTAGDFIWQQALFGTVMTFIIGVATLFGLWKPTGVDDKAKGTLRHD